MASEKRAFTGALLGGSLGTAQAFRPNPAIQGVDSTRLKLNQLLNQSGRQGRIAGNAMGILGLLFSTSESGLGYLSDGRAPDWLNTLGAGDAANFHGPETDRKRGGSRRSTTSHKLHHF